MLVFNVTFKCAPGMRERFLKAITEEGIIDACRAEDGNFKYDYYIPVESDDELLLIEKWKDADAVKAHAVQPHMQRMIELKSELVTDLILEKYETTDD